MGVAHSTPVLGEVVTPISSASAPESDSHYKLIRLFEIRLFIASTHFVLARLDANDNPRSGLQERWGETGPVEFGYIVDAEVSTNKDVTITNTIQAPLVPLGHWLDSSTLTGSGMITDGLLTVTDSLSLSTTLPSNGSLLDWTHSQELPANHTEQNAVESALQAVLRTPYTTGSIPMQSPFDSNPSPELLNTQPSATLEDLKWNPGTANIVKQFEGPIQALQALEAGRKHSFVQLDSGAILATTDEDIQAAQSAFEGLSVTAPSCFMSHETRIVVEGDIHTSERGEIYHLACRSDGIQVPLELQVDDFEQVAPRLSFASPCLTSLVMTFLKATSPPKADPARLLIYSSQMVILTYKNDPARTSVSNVRYFVAFHEKDNVQLVGLASATSAREVYDAIPSHLAKILLDRFEPKVIHAYGTPRSVRKCEEEIGRLKSFVLVRGCDLTAPPSNAPFVVAFHHNGSVDMLGCPDEDTAWKLYNRVSKDYVRVLVDRQTLDVLVSYGPIRRTSELTDVVSQLPVFDDIVPPLHAPHLVSFHVRGEVVILGYQSAETARNTYNLVSMSRTKALYSRGSLQPIACHGNKVLINICSDRATTLFSIHVSPPLQRSPHVVASHHEPHVRMVGFSTAQAAQTFFDAISPAYARVYMDKSNSTVKLESGGGYWIDLCKRVLLQQPFLKPRGSPITPDNPKYVVAYHANGAIHLFCFSTGESGRSAYEAISILFAKILMDLNKAEVLVKHGATHYTQLCETRIYELLALQRTEQLRSAPYIVGVRCVGRVKMAGFPTLKAAQCMYGAIEEDQPRILIYRRNLKPLSSFGPEDELAHCITEVQRLGPLDDGVSLRDASHLVVFHYEDRITAIGFSRGEAAHLLYLAISKSWAKLLIEGNKTIAKNGRDPAVGACTAAANSPECLEIVAPLKSASYIVAFYVNDSIGLVGFSGKHHASELYDVVSSKWAKVLFDTSNAGLVMSYGNPGCIEECKRMVLLV